MTIITVDNNLFIFCNWVGFCIKSSTMQYALVTKRSIEEWHALRLVSSLVIMSSKTDEQR